MTSKSSSLITKNNFGGIFWKTFTVQSTELDNSLRSILQLELKIGVHMNRETERHTSRLVQHMIPPSYVKNRD